ncbi:NLI interacting factor-like phosphatase-domain-containing protein [Polychytrium aggregatum]|uniref:NLI interacting factor-like phosphatase-domain-containing protein n=1 Tax=Polychytrium aggregatum TaxID=110093 RepID=UPI0022FE4D4F|nr:NLI interacting factor-like phosphatase-domain-containing protein [Polychytrium aggregatum]KAI9203976.1 NLI interacting factor-like phosphatase-domain-containing protein [Polychytrium aggregatum]
MTVNTAVRRPFLIILDINGVLIDRITDSPARRLSETNPFRPHGLYATISKRKGPERIHIRPHVDVFLKVLLENFSVATWTSAMAKNAEPLVDLIMQDRSEDLAFQWSQDKCTLTGRQVRKSNGSGNKPEIIKELQTVWESPEVNSDNRWSEKNTIIIDDSLFKARMNPKNILHIPAFTTQDHTVDSKKDMVLPSLLKYLLQVSSDETKTDVRDWPTFCEEVSAPLQEPPNLSIASFERYVVKEEYRIDPLDEADRERFIKPSEFPPIRAPLSNQQRDDVLLAGVTRRLEAIGI